MVSFNPPVQVRTAPMLHVRAESVPDRPRIRIVAVGGDLFRRCVRHRLSAAEEPLGCIHVPVGTEHRIDQIAVPVNGAIQVTPLSLNLYIGLVRVPAPAHFPLPFATDLLGQQRSKAFLPNPARLHG